MDYVKEAKEIIKDIVFEDWMSEADFKKVEKDIFTKLDLSYEKLAEQLEVGVKNGYRIEIQKELLNLIL